MEIIKTASFELATNTKGEKNAQKVAIIIPGRLDTKDYAHITTCVDLLAHKGFFALSFDPPGIWESPGDISLYNTTNYIQATQELIEYLGNRPTLLVGHSRGASTAMMVGEKNKNVIGLILLMSNFGPPTPPGETAKQEGFEKTYRDTPPGTTKTNKQKEFKLPLSYFENGALYNPGESLLNCNQPKLLIHGIEDEFTPPEEEMDIYKKIHPPKEIKQINSVHDYRYNQEAIKTVNKAIEDFVDKYIS